MSVATKDRVLAALAVVGAAVLLLGGLFFVGLVGGGELNAELKTIAVYLVIAALTGAIGAFALLVGQPIGHTIWMVHGLFALAATASLLATGAGVFVVATLPSIGIGLYGLKRRLSAR